MTNALSEALQFLIFFTFFLAHVIGLKEDVNVLNEDSSNTIGVLALLAQIVVVSISFRPALKVMYAYRAEEARLQAVLEEEIKRQSEGTDRAYSSIRGWSTQSHHHSMAVATIIPSYVHSIPAALRRPCSSRAGKGG